MTIIYKTCSKCKWNLPATTEYFHKMSTTKDGLQYECKVCKNLQAKIYEQSGRGKVTRKKCNKNYRQSEAGKQHNKVYGQLEYVKEAARQHGKKYRETEAGQLYYRQYQKKYRATISGYLRGIFYGMKERCISSKHPSYKNYGGRGIRVCFKSSDEFVEYVMQVLCVDPRGLQIDRVDNNGDYEKGNIRFVTRSENNLNKRNFGDL